MSTGTAGDVKNAGAISWAGADAGEAALVERCVSHDQAACAELVATHQRMVYALAFHLLGDRDDALDVSQEVFLRVFRTLPSFRGQSALRNQAPEGPGLPHVGPRFHRGRHERRHHGDHNDRPFHARIVRVFGPPGAGGGLGTFHTPRGLMFAAGGTLLCRRN